MSAGEMMAGEFRLQMSGPAVDAVRRRNATMQAAGLPVTEWTEPGAYQRAVEVLEGRRAAASARRRRGRVRHCETSGGWR